MRKLGRPARLFHPPVAVALARSMAPFVCMYRCNSGCPQNKGSQRCTGSQCKERQAAERQAAKAGRAGSLVSAPSAPQAEATSCFVIKKVIGVSMCLETLNNTERRCGRMTHDDEICYQVRGKFGKSMAEDQDDMEPDTRWVKLSTLVDNKLDETDCQLLDTFAKSLLVVAKEARKRLREDTESSV